MLPDPDKILQLALSEFNNDIIEHEMSEKTGGHKTTVKRNEIILTVRRKSFHRLISMLNDISPLRIACAIASKEIDNVVLLIYPFTMSGAPDSDGENMIIIKVPLPPNDLFIRSLTDIIPGILFMERELIEMMGVTIEDIPDDRPFFTAQSLPEGMYPQRLGLAQQPEAPEVIKAKEPEEQETKEES